MHKLILSMLCAVAGSAVTPTANAQTTPQMSNQMQSQRQKALAFAMRNRTDDAAREPQPVIQRGSGTSCEVNIASAPPTTGGIRAPGVHQNTQIVVIDAPPIIICNPR